MSSQGAQCPPKSGVPERARGRPQGLYAAMVLLKGEIPITGRTGAPAGVRGGGIPSVAETCRQAVPGKAEKQVVVTGGGAWNTAAGARGHGSLLRHGTSSGGGGLVGQRLGKDGRLGQSVMEEELPEPAGKQRQALPFFLFLFFCYTVQRAES